MAPLPCPYTQTMARLNRFNGINAFLRSRGQVRDTLQPHSVQLHSDRISIPAHLTGLREAYNQWINHILLTHDQMLNTKSDSEPVIEAVLGLVWALPEPDLEDKTYTPETAGERDNIDNYQEPNYERWTLSPAGINSSDFVEELGLTVGPHGAWVMIWGLENWGEILQEQGNQTCMSGLKH